VALNSIYTELGIIPYMALDPTSIAHAGQIAAGIEGRRYGHRFESALAETINSINPCVIDNSGRSNLVVNGLPGERLLEVIYSVEDIQPNDIISVRAHWLGGSATGAGRSQYELLDLDSGRVVTGNSKSDVVIDITLRNGDVVRRGISVKSCSNTIPTNAQLFFTQAVAFCRHLRRIGLNISTAMETDLRRFCGDDGFCPSSLLSSEQLSSRSGWTNRFFWEELSSREEWELLFTENQELITRFLLAEGAYVDDPITPSFVLHQTCSYDEYTDVEMYIATIDDLICRSMSHSGFHTRSYSTRGASHLAPRFGIIQFQRGGQRQHPTQLQFNLMAGYFMI
jgi:hypothetical protein